MKTSELLELDCRKTDNVKVIQLALRKIKPFANIPMSEDVPMLKLETLISKYEQKYPVKTHGIYPVFIPGEINVFKAIVSYNKKEKLIYGHTLYELFSKICIYFFYKTSKENKK